MHYWRPCTYIQQPSPYYCKLPFYYQKLKSNLLFLTHIWSKLHSATKLNFSEKIMLSLLQIASDFQRNLLDQASKWMLRKSYQNGAELCQAKIMIYQKSELIFCCFTTSLLQGGDRSRCVENFMYLALPGTGH